MIKTRNRKKGKIRWVFMFYQLPIFLMNPIATPSMLRLTRTGMKAVMVPAIPPPDAVVVDMWMLM
jgi:hypothetical protein